MFALLSIFMLNNSYILFYITMAVISPANYYLANDPLIQELFEFTSQNLQSEMSISSNLFSY